MSQQKHLFVMDELDKLTLELDTSLRFAFALDKKGSLPYYCTIKELSASTKDGGLAHCSRILFESEVGSAKAAKREHLALSEFKSIHMRKDPPFNLDYIEATWVLDRAPKSTLLLNSPSMLRGFNEKMGILDFPEECLDCLVSSSAEQILDYLEKQPSKTLILKPLDLFGGRGVIKVHGPEAKKLVTEATENGAKLIMAQPFLEEIYEGEVRVFTIDAKSVAWCLKRPAKGEYLANTRMGATLHDFQPTKELEKSVETIAKALRDKGVYILGMDIIGNKITEINITSPRLLLKDLSDLSGFDHYADWVTQF